MNLKQKKELNKCFRWCYDQMNELNEYNHGIGICIFLAQYYSLAKENERVYVFASDLLIKHFRPESRVNAYWFKTLKERRECLEKLIAMTE